MTDLNFKQCHPSGFDTENPWRSLVTYQLTPWPSRCTITYYDFGTRPYVKIGDRTRFDWANGSAEYEAVTGGLDPECRLLPGSTWEEPPPEALKR